MFRLRLVAGLTLAVGLLPAADSPEAGQVRALNNSLLQLHDQLQRATPSQAAALRLQAAPVLQRRAAALSALIERNASEALSLAFSQDLLSRLAEAFPQSASLLESQGVWQGPIEYFILDEPNMTSHRSVRRMRVGQETLEIHFAGREPAGLKSGDLLRVQGVRAGNNVAAAGGTVTSSTVAPLTCSTTGVQNAAVLLVTFPGVPAPSNTPQSIYDIFFSASGRTVDGFWREASYNQAWASGNVFGWYTLDASYTCDQYTQMRDAAIRAADADVDFRNYTRVFIVFPTPSGCSWAGLGTLGCSSLSSTGDGSFTASTAWLVANYMSTRDQGVKLAAHEGGHNLMLHHASSRDFGTEALGPLGASGTLSEYGDQFSTMGYWNLGQYSAQHKAQLGWIAEGANYQTVQSGGSFSLQPIEISPPGLQAVKVQRGTGNNAWLWVEYRQPSGIYDSTLGTQVYSGALIHYQDSTTGTHTHLLDYTPETSSWSDPALATGKTWVDPYTNVSLWMQSASASALTVSVNYGALPCTQASPAVSISPVNPSLYAGNSVGYSVSVTNDDSAGCASSTFTLSSSQPFGWPTTFSTTSLSLSPGQTASVTMTKTAPAGATPATYAVDAASSDGSFSSSGTANCTVMAPPPPLTVTVSVPSLTYTNRSTVPITVNVMSGVAPAAGATVTFTMTKANGSTAARTVTADSAGNAVWNYKVGPKDPKGAYSVSAQAAYGSQTATSTSVTFVIQ